VQQNDLIHKDDDGIKMEEFQNGQENLEEKGNNILYIMMS
jgi:hypothetical protein